jgi:hypothetical protein
MGVYVLALVWLAPDRAGGYATTLLPGVVLWGLALGLLVTPLTSTVLAAVADDDLGEASAISDVAARFGGAILIALLPALLGVRPGGDLAEAVRSGYTTAMLALAGLAAAAAVITALLVRDHRTVGPRFAPPAPYLGCSLPDRGTAAPLPAAAGSPSYERTDP